MSTANRTCLICDQPIEPERLEAMPNTYFCAGHARERRCQHPACGSEVEAERVVNLPETLYCAAHAPKERGCRVCLRPIEDRRREAAPESGLCEEHFARAKRYGGEFKRVVERKKLGKPGISGGKGGDIETNLEVNTEAIGKLREEYLKGQGYKDL
jgi:hypothetical protein